MLTKQGPRLAIYREMISRSVYIHLTQSVDNVHLETSVPVLNNEQK